LKIVGQNLKIDYVLSELEIIQI